jgi:hypoxanthine-guanine phosphoribosyltransferase
MITKEEFQNNFEKLVTKSDLEKVVDRVKREITTEMTGKEVIICCTLSFSPVCVGFFFNSFWCLFLWIFDSFFFGKA